MHINVAQLLKEPVGSTRSHKIDASIDEEGIDSVKGELTLTLTRTNRSILVAGTLTATIAGTCNRCLNRARCIYNFNLEEEFFPIVDISSGSVSPEESGSSNTIDNNNMLDLTEVIRQYSVLSIPTKLLCSPECAGLCPSCGYNLNQGSCQCSNQNRSKRLSKPVKLGKENKI